jgi:phosphatidylserine/phosphatidylglycerophosphate/cardiolipin synthase-like enzyme
MDNENPHYIPFATSCSYPVRAGNLVQPLVDGVPTFRRIGAEVDAARHSVWVAVTFYADDFLFPDGRGPLFDALDRAVARGVDVRVLFWRPNPESSHYGRNFPGSPENREMLRRRDARFRIRWDRAASVYCHHQKSWMIDAGHASETAFVGGINLTAANLGVPGHAGDGQRHDAYVEITGPSATDIHHNFVQRWNEASEREAEDGNWACDPADVLAFPERASPPAGSSTVQIQRMIGPGRYANGHPTPGGSTFDVAQGERSILEQYGRAIDAARRTIYLENQAIPIPAITGPLLRALERGVDVVLLVPAIPEDHVYEARLNGTRQALFDGLEALGRHPNFTLAGIAGRDGARRRSAYVHAKLMVVDDVWATIGSCNLHAYSLGGHSEINASIWDAAVVRAFRRTLLAEHLDRETGELDDRAAFRLYRTVARENRCRMQNHDPDWQGLAFALSPEKYGRKSDQVPS